jgi:predicted MPP superfamily phosphohydrolase
MDFNKREIEKEKRKQKKKAEKRFYSSLNKTLKFLLKNKITKSMLKKDVFNLCLKNYKIESKKIPRDLKILFLSDLHLEIVDNIENIENLIKDKKYDFIILGGDYYDKDESILKEEDKIKSLFKILKNKTDNLITVMGNHDGKHIANFLKSNSVLLLNDNIMFKELNINILGAEDFVTFNETKDDFVVNKEDFNLIISHTPDFIGVVEKGKYDLSLSGHTHGGQVTIFNFAPINNCVDKKMIYGKWEHNGNIGITSSGVGCSGVPVRIGVKPEIVEIDIIKK